MIDLVYVSYNSKKWIAGCFNSLLNVTYDLKKINVYVVDNASTDDSVAELEEFARNKGNLFGKFEVIPEKKNWGFGKANNVGFSKGNGDIVCFLNIDTEVFEDTFDKLEYEVKNSQEQVAVWEFRQFPYEHPKMYDPLTGETNWVSGAAFAVRRVVYDEVGGFDEKIFMYAEDVDLSWRIRCAGYTLKYVPKVRITHYSYTSAGELKPNQHVFGVINNLMLRYRFGDRATIMDGHRKFWSLILVHQAAFPGAKKALLRQYFKHFANIAHFKSHGKYKHNDRNVGEFYGWDYCQIRDGAFFVNEALAEKPLVSIIVRTCGRPDVLRETLISLRNQTYDNLEIVVVEDGKPTAKEMISSEFSDMNILYHATVNNVGRSKAGNLAMEMAHGQYLNFLDDDDLFYADHVEVLVNTILKSGLKAAYATGYETPIEIYSKAPYKYRVLSYLGIHKQAFDRVMLCHHNYIPIQCIMFDKSLFEQYGGLDETVDALEDWDMWVRYSLYTDFAFVLKTTSIYRVPAVREVNENRQKALDDALIVMREKHKKYFQKISVHDLAKMYEQRGY